MTIPDIGIFLDYPLSHIPGRFNGADQQMQQL